MSVLIKGMEMPTSCMLCPFCVEEADPANGEMCMVTGTLMPPCTRERLDSCPLVPVPPHGDLIDRNALKIAVMDCDVETRIDFLKHAMDCINKAPVVIPSDLPTYEEEEGET